MINKLERLLVDAAGSGESAVRAVTDIRGLLRPSIPTIDAIGTQCLLRFAWCILEELQPPPEDAVVSSSAVERTLKEAQVLAEDLAFGDAAHVLAAQLTQIENGI